ncbi:MAG: cytochrome c3 family protein [Deltaproteobacteria bacterium]|nr:cytochrome c3 family protein [Deltaproteobacteria bacterium]
MTIRRGKIAACVAGLLLALPPLCEATLKGECSNCHTMHNSQQGTLVAFSRDSSGRQVLQITPYNMLLKTDCIGCHSDPGSETIVTKGETQIPIVFNLSEPIYPPDGSSSSSLAGGNFHWVVRTGDAYGHNVFGLSGQDSRFAQAPGDTVVDECATCHRTLATAQGGCTGCHVPQHHAGGPGLVAGRTHGWYRFLGSVMQRSGQTLTAQGVVGIEDPEWEQKVLPTRHNTYKGSTTPGGSYLDTGSINQKCTGCHGRFHNETVANSVWIRHPVDVAIPDSGEFTGLTTYDPRAPVARWTVTDADANFSSVTRGSDLVSCVSCHRPHGSPYPALLRWNYRAWPGIDPQTGNPAVNGCAVCHTAKG